MDVYPEIVETAEDESRESDEAMTPGVARLWSCLFSKSILDMVISSKRLAHAGYYSILDRYAWWCKRTGLTQPLLLVFRVLLPVIVSLVL